MAFKIVKLSDGTHFEIEDGGLCLDVKLYSAENPPKVVEKNNSGTLISS